MKHIIERFDMKSVEEFQETSKYKIIENIVFYLIIFITIITFGCFYFIKKEVSTTLTGYVNLASESDVVLTNSAGYLESINIKDGTLVNKGDVIFTLIDEELKNEKSSIETEINQIKTDFEGAMKLRESINARKNMLDNSVERQKKYFIQYQQFEEEMLNYENNSEIVMTSNSQITNKYLLLVQNDIDSLDSKLEIAKKNLDNINSRIDKLTVKASESGRLTFLNSIKVGEYIEFGKELAYILPTNKDEINIDIIIPFDEINNIVEGQEINVTLEAFEGKESEYLKTNIGEISKIATYLEDGSSGYYKAKCKLDLKGSGIEEKKIESIKNGMGAQIKIITGEVSYLEYLFESIGIN